MSTCRAVASKQPKDVAHGILSYAQASIAHQVLHIPATHTVFVFKQLKLPENCMQGSVVLDKTRALALEPSHR